MLTTFAELPVLLRGTVAPLKEWTSQPRTRRIVGNVLIIIGGTAAFGAAIGMWRAPLQAFYTALKLPLIVLLTTLGNGLINGMVAPLLGTPITFRQSMLAVLMSFSIAGAVLGACSPLLAFLIWNAPPLSQGSSDWATHNLILLTLVAVITAAGVAGNVRLLRLLHSFSGAQRSARRTLWAWLLVNLLLGSQLSWILRPFVGSPGLAVQFIRDDALSGNFFESIFRTVAALLR